jgi:hypothetical protein
MTTTVDLTTPTTAVPADLRITELERDLSAARVAEQAERDRRLSAEESRDQWVAIAQGRGVQLGRTAGLGDPQLAIDAAHAAERRARDQNERLSAEARHARLLVDGLAVLVRALPRLPIPVKRLHPDTVMVLDLLLSAHYRAAMVLDAPALPAEVVAEIRSAAAEWGEVRRHSMATVSAGPWGAAGAASDGTP